jgi:hypothetical protein
MTRYSALFGSGISLFSASKAVNVARPIRSRAVGANIHLNKIAASYRCLLEGLSTGTDGGKPVDTPSGELGDDSDV